MAGACFRLLLHCSRRACFLPLSSCYGRSTARAAVDVWRAILTARPHRRAWLQGRRRSQRRSRRRALPGCCSTEPLPSCGAGGLQGAGARWPGALLLTRGNSPLDVPMPAGGAGHSCPGAGRVSVGSARCACNIMTASFCSLGAQPARVCVRPGLRDSHTTRSSGLALSVTPITAPVDVNSSQRFKACHCKRKGTQLGYMIQEW